MNSQTSNVHTDDLISVKLQDLGQCWYCGFLSGMHSTLNSWHESGLGLPSYLFLMRSVHDKDNSANDGHVFDIHVLSTLKITGVETNPRRLSSGIVRSISPGGWGYTVLTLESGSRTFFGDLAISDGIPEHGQLMYLLNDPLAANSSMACMRCDVKN